MAASEPITEIEAESGHEGDAPLAPITLLPIASIQLRVVAFILDCILLFGFFMLFFAVGGVQVLAQGSDPPNSAIYIWLGIMALFLFPFAPLLFFLLLSWRSQTLGMMAVGLIVTNRDGYRLSHSRALLRTVTWPLSVLPFGAGLVAIFFDKERRALHDHLAGTVVREVR